MTVGGHRNNVILSAVASQRSSVADLLAVFPVFPVWGAHDATGLSRSGNEARVISLGDRKALFNVWSPLASWPRVSYPTSLGLRIFICKTGAGTATALDGGCERLTEKALLKHAGIFWNVPGSGTPVGSVIPFGSTCWLPVNMKGPGRAVHRPDWEERKGQRSGGVVGAV